MYEINRVDKRQRTIKNFTNYFILAIIISLVTIILVLATEGYDINRSTGELIQNGIVLIESQPAGADVYLNDLNEANRTPAKLPIPEGSYQARLELDGYNSWQSPIQVIGSKVNWISYPLLIPEQINTTQVASLSNLNFIESNSQNDTLLVNQSNSKNVISLYDLGAKKLTPLKITIPRQLFTLQKAKIIGLLSFRGWSENGRFVWLDYTVGDTTNALLIDLDEPLKSVNLTSLFGHNFDLVSFSGNDVYLLSSELLFKPNISIGQLSLPQGNGIKLVKTQGNQVLVEREINGASSLSLLTQLEKPIIVPNQSIEDFEISEFDGHLVLAAQYLDSVEIYQDLDLADQKANVPVKVIQIDGKNNRTDFSDNGRFLAVFSDTVTIIYDLENQRDYRVQYGALNDINWLDDYHFSYGVGGQLFIVDFNGSNAYPIASNLSQYGTFLNTQKTALITVDTSAQTKTLVLRSSSLIGN